MKNDQLRKAILFERPDYIPMTFVINQACWHHYHQEQLLDLMESHPFLFPEFQRPTTPVQPVYSNCARKDEPYTDDFGCVWFTADDGITGTVTKHPLNNWESFGQYAFPNPSQCMGIGPVDWAAEASRIQKARANGDFTVASLRHGHTFLQLCDMRGYTNLMYDMADEEPLLNELIARLEHFNQYIVDRYIGMGVDMMCYPEDLGMQLGPMISPDHFKRFIKPSYERLMRKALEAETIVHLHSDGDIRELADDLIDDGVQVMNLQDLVNGIDWIEANLKGRLCIELDLDRQKITPFGTPKEIDALICEEVRRLSTPQGGYAMIYGLYPGVPIENVEAVMNAMEKYAFHHD